MSTYSLEELMHRWVRGEITAEQGVGQLLQHVKMLQAQANALEHQINTLSANLSSMEDDEVPPPRKKRTN